MELSSRKANRLKSIDLIVWDEAANSSLLALKIVDKLLKKIMDNDLLFGGKILVLGGIFL